MVTELLGKEGHGGAHPDRANDLDSSTLDHSMFVASPNSLVVVGSHCAGDKPATVKDVMLIATGFKREDLEAELQVRQLGLLWGSVGGCSLIQFVGV